MIDTILFPDINHMRTFPTSSHITSIQTYVTLK